MLSMLLALASLALPAPGTAVLARTSSAPTAEPDTVVMRHDPLKYQIVVSATKVAKPREEVPNATSVISGVELRRRGTRTVGEALQDLVGVDTGEGSDNGLRLPNIGLWGLKEFDALLVTLDGVPVGGPFNPSLAQIPVEDIDRIEVVKGPQGTLYGVAAFAGMVQVFTRPDRGHLAHVTAGGGSFGDGHGSGGVRFTGPHALSAGVFGALQRSDGWQARTSSAIDRGGVSLLRGLGPGFVALDLSMTRDTQRWGTPQPFDEDNGVPFAGFRVDRNYAVRGARLDHHLLQLASRLGLPLGSRWRVENTLGVTRDLQNSVRSFPEPDSLDASGDVPSEGVALRPKETTVFEDGRLVRQFALAGRHEAVAGAAVTWGRTTARGAGFDFDQNIHDPASIPDVGQVPAGDVRSFDDRRTFLGVYAHDEWTPAAPVTIAGGGRWDRTSEKLHARARELATNELAARDDERTDGAWSGDISALVRLIRTETHAVQAINPYLAWKSSFKPAAPNLTEAERAEILAPERTHSIEGGIKTRWLLRQLSFDASVFRMTFDNLVVAALGPDHLPALVNAGEERFTGYELELGAAPDFVPGTTLTLGVAHHDARFVRFTALNPEGEVEDFAGRRLELVPRDLLNAKLSLVGPRGIGVFGAVRYQGKRPLNRDNTHFAGAYTEYDAGASLEYRELLLSVTGRNLGNDRHVVAESDIGESQLYVAPPRRFSAEVTYEF